MSLKRKFTKTNELAVLKIDGNYRLISLDGEAVFSEALGEYRYSYLDVTSEDYNIDYAPESKIMSLEDFYNQVDHSKPYLNQLNAKFVIVTDKSQHLKRFGRLGVLTGESYVSRYNNETQYVAHISYNKDNWIGNTDYILLNKDEFISLEEYTKNRSKSKLVMKEIKFNSTKKYNVKDIEAQMKTLSVEELESLRDTADDLICIKNYTAENDIAASLVELDKQ